MNLDNFIRGKNKGDMRRMYANMFLRDYVNVWMKTFKADSIKPSSLGRLETTAKAMEQYSISDIKIKDITAFDIQMYVNEVTAKGYSLSTIKKMMRIVTAPLKQAAALHFIAADPSFGVKLPSPDKVKKQKRETRAYTEEEQKKLWSVIDKTPNPMYDAVGLMLETGLRCGEILALRWRCVDIEKKRLRVEATLLNYTKEKRSAIQETPKTISSKRTVPLTKKAIEILKRLKSDNEWVFEKEGGHWFTYESLRWNTCKLCREADVEYLGEHVFRHTFATNCYYKKMDVKILSKILGHSDVNITYNIYINLLGDGFDEMYNALVNA